MTTGDLPADSRVARLIELALIEDAAMGDLTSEAIFPEDQLGEGTIVCKEPGVLAGLEAATLVFRLCDPEAVLEASAADGDRVKRGQSVAHVAGPVRAILLGERTALNFLQRMSGIATLTRRYVDAVAGTRARITDTRKTAPGLRLFDKLAVVSGGGLNHRFGLDDMVLIKDNHIAAAGGIRNAVTQAVAWVRERHLSVGIEVETTTLDEVDEALSCEGITRIMLDNFPLDTMRRAVQRIGGRMEIEASGGITLRTVRAVAETGVDLISVGALTHSPGALDLSLEVSPHVR
jgi:nicotinate-nucleotide pyrophosphorylase (carboxylating)